MIPLENLHSIGGMEQQCFHEWRFFKVKLGNLESKLNILNTGFCVPNNDGKIMRIRRALGDVGCVIGAGLVLRH